MADTPDPDISVPLEETPAQRQSRIRRQKRESKAASNGSERLDKITRLSGRTPESMRTESPAPTPPQSATPSRLPSYATPQDGTPNAEQLRLQEEYLRTMLRQPLAQDGANDQAELEEDPMMKMLQSMMGNLAGDADNPNAPPGAEGAFGTGLGLSPADISKATGLPQFIVERFLGGQKAPPSKAEIQATRFWKIVHVIFAFTAGLYLVFTINKATETFGENPPAPATFQNPFLAFVIGEILIQTTRIATKNQSGKTGAGLGMQMLKQALGDGAVVVFLLGVFGVWWNGAV